MKLTLPKQTAAELLLFLSEHEQFSSVEKLIEASVSTSDVKGLLKEISAALMRSDASEYEANRYDVKKDAHLSAKSKKVISYLSPYEEKALLKAFGMTQEL